MALTTRYPGQIVIAENPSNIVFGTVMLGNVYGTVESASVTRQADIKEVEAAGGILLAIILSKPDFAFKFKVLFSDDKTPPDFAELIQFPFAGIQGRVLPPIVIDWEKSGHRMLSIEAKSWDSFAGYNQGGGNASRYESGVYTPIGSAVVSV